MTFQISDITIPPHCGIYLMRDASNQIIYIGKAKNLKNRVRSYFVKKVDYKTQKLVENIADIEFVLTDNEGEAFILESNMIKKHRPRFNIELKDQERYTYLRLSDERFPRLQVARRSRSGKFIGKGQTFGPFTHGSSKLLTIGSLRKAFKIRICKTLPKKVCLEYHLGNCEGPCEFVEAEQDYLKHVSDLKDVLKGKDQMRIFTQKLAGQMHTASESEEFERAIEIRDTLKRLDSLQTSQKMDYIKDSDEEFFGISVKNQYAVVMTFRKINGVIRDSDKFMFDAIADNNFGNFLYQYYTTRKIPKNIIVGQIPENQSILMQLLSDKAGHQVKIIIPKRGKNKQMLDLIMKNIDLIHAKGGDPALIELQKYLMLQVPPKTIECFDVSNHGESFAVGAMSRFVDGKPDTSGYRKFKIKFVKGRNDFAMINEIVKRRYLRLQEEGKKLPDLILIDGGKGQLHAALDALTSLGANIACVSLAKEHEEVFLPGKKDSIVIPKTKESLKILQYARDEAHRFGVTYNRKIRKMNIEK